MKGLIIKDLMCLKKNIRTFFFVAIATLVISVMAVLSAKFGNIALLERVAEDNSSNVSPLELLWFAISIMVMLPIMSVGDGISGVFAADRNAGFAAVAGAMPVSVKKRVEARYLSVLSMCGAGVSASLIIAVILSFFTDIMSIGEFVGLVLMASSVMLIFVAVEMVLIIAFNKASDYCGQLAFLIMCIAAGIVIAIKWNSIKQMIFELRVFDIAKAALNLFKDRWYIFALIAAVCLLFSYLTTVHLAERKRGVI